MECLVLHHKQMLCGQLVDQEGELNLANDVEEDLSQIGQRIEWNGGGYGP